ncbi:hypothetical protein RD792_015579 [Penstemon davidsonii]|uniref:Uncharacterized protein n=1 Tax=Penstemon davidsonii TaxID=160366 RepID=A0ABR0CIV3_9LAMI|nr:hypothetical protein RD792_015579 [Penstemon davidsonii]
MDCDGLPCNEEDTGTCDPMAVQPVVSASSAVDLPATVGLHVSSGVLVFCVDLLRWVLLRLLGYIDENFIVKSGAQRVASSEGGALIAPDTSPRGLNVEGVSDSWDFGVGMTHVSLRVVERTVFVLALSLTSKCYLGYESVTFDGISSTAQDLQSSAVD